MTPFDGVFANSYALPQAASAYDSVTPPAGTRSWEILASPAAANAVITEQKAGIAPAHSPEFEAMIRQPRQPIAQEEATGAHFHSLQATPPNLHFGWITVDEPRKTLTIAIRGTQFFSEWLKDFTFVPVPYKPVPAFLRLVHLGFQIVYYSIRDSIAASLAAAFAAYPSLETVLITGHSLGAAVVGIAAPDILLSHIGGRTPLVYTFAEPRVGMPIYAHFSNRTLPVCYRIRNRWDIVPDQPPVVFGYEHEGVEVVIDSGFTLDPKIAHPLKTGYVPGMAQWVLDHPAGAAAIAHTPTTIAYIGVAP